MRLVTTIEGQIVNVDISEESGSVRFTSPVLSKEYRTPEDIESALKAWDLTQRKNFTNREAWIIQRTWSQPAQAIAVTVTSVSPDGKEVWVRISGKREKKRVEELFADHEEVEDALRIERVHKSIIQDAWESCAKWTPTTTNAAEAAFPGGTMEANYEKTTETETEAETVTPNAQPSNPGTSTTTTTTETPSTGSGGGSESPSGGGNSE